METPFWPDRAWSQAVGAAWPFYDPDHPEVAPRLRTSLLPYWSKRLERVPQAVLSPPTRVTFDRRAMNSDVESHCAGYDLVERAANSVPEALWSLDLGCAAWAVALRRLRVSGGYMNEAELNQLAALERVWAREGASGALSALDRWVADSAPALGILYLYHAVLSLWHRHDIPGAYESFDRANSRLLPAHRDIVGLSLPLTMSLLRQLDRRHALAVEVLESALPQARERWTPGAVLEMEYHYARALWSCGRGQEVAPLMVRLVRANPSYLLRFASDPAWGTHPGDVGAIYIALNQDADQLRAEMLRWQRTVPPSTSGPDPFARVRDLLLHSATDLYPLFAAARARVEALEAGAVEPFTPPASFHTNLENLRTCVGEMPALFPFRIGRHPSSRFHGVPGSDIDLLEARLKEKAVDGAVVDYVSALMETLPDALRQAMYEYGSRLINSLVQAIDHLEDRGDPASVRLANELAERGQRVVTQVNGLENISRHVNRALGKDVAALWKAFADLETFWARAINNRHGRVTVKLPSEYVEISSSVGWKAIRAQVVDNVGSPVSAVVVSWRVVSGPAVPREPAAYLSNEWSASLEMGVVYFTVSIPDGSRAGESGIIEAQVLGSDQTISIAYTVS